MFDHNIIIVMLSCLKKSIVLVCIYALATERVYSRTQTRATLL